ncbi:hypothetical protein Hanom_Chr12g01119801 [Helianthus anomalus]
MSKILKSKVHAWSLWLTKILDLVSRFPKVHGWSLWFAFCNEFHPPLLPKVHGWSPWFVVCSGFSP